MGLANYPFVYTTQQDISFLLNSRTLWIHTNFVICYNSKLLFYKAVVFPRPQRWLGRRRVRKPLFLYDVGRGWFPVRQ